MDSSPPPGSPLPRAVYLSVPIGFSLPAFKVAQRLCASGAHVFLDEPTGMFEEGMETAGEQRETAGARRGARHIPLAICYADELLVLLPKPTHADGVSEIEIFPRRDFLVIALTGARIWNIQTTVFLPRPLKRRFVQNCRSAPPFLTDWRLSEQSEWDEYYRQLDQNIRQRRTIRNFIKIDQGLRVCLCWVSDTQLPEDARQDGQEFQARLDRYGLDSDLVVWTKDERAKWSPTHNPSEDFDALAVCARGNESGPWKRPEFKKLFDRVDGERCPVLFVRKEPASCRVPVAFADRPHFECFKNAPDDQILALVRALIGFKDWRSQVTAATQELRQSEPTPPTAPRLEPPRGVPSAPPPEPLSPVAPPPSVPAPVNPTVAPQLIPEPYAVFFRIVGIKDRTADEQAVAADVLDSEVDSLRSHTAEVLNGPNGRFVLMRKVKEALDLARQLHKSCAAKGVRLATGLANGPVVETHDLKGSGRAGPVLNLAARLAHLDNGANRTAIDEYSWNQARAATSQYRQQLGKKLTSGRVKRTDLTFCWLKHPGLKLGPLPRPREQHDSETAHIVVYDMARFSEQKREDLALLANQMNEAARRALGGSLDLMTNGTNGWYIPGGDGGVLVFRTHREGAAHDAWRFVTEMRKISASMQTLPIRIGVATGQVVDRGQKPPVGTGIDDADTLSANAVPGKPCVQIDFWLNKLDDHDRVSWVAESIPDLPNVLLVHPR